MLTEAKAANQRAIAKKEEAIADLIQATAGRVKANTNSLEEGEASNQIMMRSRDVEIIDGVEKFIDSLEKKDIDFNVGNKSN